MISFILDEKEDIKEEIKSEELELSWEEKLEQNKVTAGDVVAKIGASLEADSIFCDVKALPKARVPIVSFKMSNLYIFYLHIILFPLIAIYRAIFVLIIA